MTAAARAVLKPLYPPLRLCTIYTQTMLSADRMAVLFNLEDGSPAYYHENPNDSLASQAAQTISACGAAARHVRDVHLSGSLAHNASLRHVLAQLTAYASDIGQAASYSSRLSFDIASGDASSAKADFDNVTSAQRAADAHLAATIPYIGKL